MMPKLERRMNETQIVRMAQSEANRIDQIQEGKLAEELTNGMALLAMQHSSSLWQNQRRTDHHSLCKSWR